MTVALLSKPNRSAFVGENVSAPTEVILIQFDASISEVYTREKEITQNPVEAGADVTDHTRTLPTEIEINGWVSDDPIIFLRSLRAEPSVKGGNPATRAADAWRELNRIMDEESLVKVVTDLDEFPDMILTSIRVPRDKDKGRVLDATIRLKKIVIATTEVTEPPAPTQNNRAPKTKKGKQVGKTPTESKEASILAKLVGNP